MKERGLDIIEWKASFELKLLDIEEKKHRIEQKRSFYWHVKTE
jgi:hypothetical protein